MIEEFVIMKVYDTYGLYKFTRSGVCLSWVDFYQKWSSSLRPSGIEDMPRIVGTFEEVLTQYKVLKELTEDQYNSFDINSIISGMASFVVVPTYTHNIGLRVTGGGTNDHSF